MKTKDQKLARIAAIFAVSNLGHFHNIKIERLIEDGPFRWTEDAYSEVCVIAGHLMESYEHEEIFGDEANGWLTQLKSSTIEEIAQRWPHHSEWLMKIAAIPES